MKRLLLVLFVLSFLSSQLSALNSKTIDKFLLDANVIIAGYAETIESTITEKLNARVKL